MMHAIAMRLRDYHRVDFQLIWELDQACFPPGIAYYCRPGRCPGEQRIFWPRNHCLIVSDPDVRQRRTVREG
jgi:hypothetical protein